MFELKKFFLILLLLLSSMTYLNAQQEDSQAEGMKIWTEYMTPGPMHEMMAKNAGDWKTIDKFWMSPGGEPMVTEGISKTEMILGGRYQKSTHTSSMMGMPTEGINIIGYDNATQEFTSVWIDNVGTGTSISKGKYDEQTKSLTMEGTMVDPITKSELKYKQIMKILDENHHLIEMYTNYNGQEFKSLEIEFFRQ